MKGETSYRQTKPVPLVEARIQASDKCTCRKQQRLLDPCHLHLRHAVKKNNFLLENKEYSSVYIYPQDDGLG